MTLLLSALAGALGWTFSEYAIHNWVGHKTRGRTEFSREHLAHHRDETYFTPTLRKARAAATVLVPLGLALGWVAGAAGLAFTLGYTVMYVAYEVLHRRTHTHAPRNRYARWARRHHLHHHHRNANANHGVTSPVWDWVFRTLEPCPVVRVPRARAPRWMVDEAGEVRPEYAGEYVLVGPVRRAAARS